MRLAIMDIYILGIVHVVVDGIIGICMGDGDIPLSTLLTLSGENVI